MPKLLWDNTGERIYETGIQNGVLYVRNDLGLYTNGVVWNGLISISESPSGAETTPLYADNIKYLNLVSAEEFSATIEAYTSPDEFMECDGTIAVASGVFIGQQNRKTFGLAYRTTLGDDVVGNERGYKIHIIYGCLASPSDRSYSTINDSPEAITFSWEVTTTPVPFPGHKATACVTIDSTKVDPDDLEALETILFGGDESSEIARLPLPEELLTIFTNG